MDIVQINVEARENLGRKATKELRKKGMIPAIIYSKKNGVTHFATKHSDVKSIVFSPDFKLAEISLNGVSKKAILKDIVFHPVTDEIQHMDFLELVDGQPLKATIPVKFKGTSPGVKAGGKFIETLRTVKIKTKPETLVDNLFVSIDELELGSAVRVKDIEVPEGIEIMVEGSIPVAKVEIPRVLKSEDEELEGEEGVVEEGEEGAEVSAE